MHGGGILCGACFPSTPFQEHHVQAAMQESSYSWHIHSQPCDVAPSLVVLQPSSQFPWPTAQKIKEISTSSKPFSQLGICQNVRASEWFMLNHVVSRVGKINQQASPSTCTAWVQQCDRLQEEASKPNAMTLTLRCVHMRCPVQSGLP